MFHIIPNDCILLIIGYLTLRRKGRINKRGYIKWDKSITDNMIYAKGFIGRLYNDERYYDMPTFCEIFPLLSISKEMNKIFDTVNVWAYLYEQEFRNGVCFKRPPKSIKTRMKDKVELINKKRNDMIYSYTSRCIEKDNKEIVKYIRMVNKIDDGFRNMVKDPSFITHYTGHPVVPQLYIIVDRYFIGPSYYDNNDIVRLSDGSFKLNILIATHIRNLYRDIINRRRDTISRCQSVLNKLPSSG